MQNVFVWTVSDVVKIVVVGLFVGAVVVYVLVDKLDKIYRWTKRHHDKK